MSLKFNIFLYPDMELITADCRDEFEILYWRGQNQVRSDGSGKLDRNDFEGNVTQSAAMFETGWLKMSQNAVLLLRLGGVSRQPTSLRWRGTCLGVTTAVSLRGWGHVQSQLAAQCASLKGACLAALSLECICIFKANMKWYNLEGEGLKNCYRNRF